MKQSMRADSYQTVTLPINNTRSSILSTTNIFSSPMAFTRKSTTTRAAALILLVIAAAVVIPATASTLTAYNGSCVGDLKRWSCGCQNMVRFRGGYVFQYNGKSATLYRGRRCTGSYTVLNSASNDCNGHPYLSANVTC